MIVPVMVLMCFLSFSCGSDNNDDVSTKVKFKNIVNEYDNGVEVLTYSFTYGSDSKLEKFSGYYANGECEFDLTITYSGNKVIMKGIANDHQCTQTYTLNDKGLATSCDYQDNVDSPDIEYINTTFQYTGNYLTSASSIKKYNDIRYSTSCSFNYSNGNLTSASNEHNNFTATYGSDLNKSGAMSYLFEHSLWDYQAAYYAGILGSPCVNLPYKISENSKEYSIIYTFDDNGYINNESIANSSGKWSNYKFTYNN